MEIAQVVSFLLVSATLACTPGADWAFIISSVIGKKGYIPAVWGLLTGYLLHTALLVCGIAALVASSPDLLLWLTTAGAIYLFWLGLMTINQWRSAKFYDGEDSPEAQRRSTKDTLPAVHSDGNSSLKTVTRARMPSAKTQFLKGLLTSGTNPKALLLYVALIPQFLSPGASLPLGVQTTIFGLGHFAVSVAIYFAVAKLARLLLSSRPAAARIVTLCSGIIMVGLSLWLIFEQFMTS